jgi:hypothetical protein
MKLLLMEWVSEGCLSSKPLSGDCWGNRTRDGNPVYDISVWSQSLDVSPTKSLPGRDRARSLRMPSLRRRWVKPGEVRLHAANQGESYASRVAPAEFVEHCNIRCRLEFPRSSAASFCRQSVKSPSRRHNRARSHLPFAKRHWQYGKPQARDHCAERREE